MNIQDIFSYYEIQGKDCLLTIEPRIPHCTRGRWYAKVFRTKDPWAYGTDANSWPRYFFDLIVAKSECIKWMKANGVFTEGSRWEKKRHEI